MKTLISNLVIASIFLLTACGKAPHSSSTSGGESHNGNSPHSSESTVSQPTSNIEPSEISTPDAVNFDLENRENRLVKQEVLKRIDVMPNLTDEEKDKLYVQVERARAMGKIISIPFTSGEHALQASAINSLQQAVKLPQIEKLSRDPTVVFVVLGYADKKGDAKTNLVISRQRADEVAKALEKKAGVMNVIHAVGMGSSEMFDSENLEKNRIVEVWAVLP